MKLITWNCCRGAYAARIAAALDLGADVAILQECARPDTLLGRNNCAWFGSNTRQGVAIVTSNGFSVEALSPAGGASAYAARIVGAVSFNLLAVWSVPDPTYARAVTRELESRRAFLLDAPVVVAGINTNGIWDADDRSVNHSTLVCMLAEEFGLVSAYHQHFSELQGRESRPTHYWQWHEAKPFHIDYCFIPQSWVPAMGSVAVGNYQDWARQSDHRPLAVDLLDAVLGDVAPTSPRE